MKILNNFSFYRIIEIKFSYSIVIKLKKDVIRGKHHLK